MMSAAFAADSRVVADSWQPFSPRTPRKFRCGLAQSGNLLQILNAGLCRARDALSIRGQVMMWCVGATEPDEAGGRVLPRPVRSRVVVATLPISSRPEIHSLGAQLLTPSVIAISGSRVLS